MNKLLVGAAAAALLGAFAPAVAQTAPPPGVAQGTTTVIRTPSVQSAPHVRLVTNREMTRGEVVKHVETLFAKLDANRDGYVTREEAGSLHERAMRGMHKGRMHGDMTRRLAERGIHLGDSGGTFDRLDTNKDGNISRQEFTTAQPQIRQERVIVMRDGAGAHPPRAPGMQKMRMHRMGGAGFGGALFYRADVNKDGRVSLAEAQSAALAHFDRADTNRDGRITPDERRNVRVMRIERRGS